MTVVLIRRLLRCVQVLLGDEDDTKIAAQVTVPDPCVCKERDALEVGEYPRPMLVPSLTKEQVQEELT